MAFFIKFELMKFNRQATLENELVRMRALTEGDRENLFLAANDPLIWEQHPAKRFKKEVFDVFFNESIATGGALAIEDKNSGKIIGSSRFNIIPGKVDSIEIGWSFLQRKYWGGKYNASFKELMMDHAFASVENVLYYVALENYRSQNAVLKIGGTLLTGDQYESYKKPNKDHKIYIITKNTWKKTV